MTKCTQCGDDFIPETGICEACQPVETKPGKLFYGCAVPFMIFGGAFIALGWWNIICVMMYSNDIEGYVGPVERFLQGIFG